jgi:acetyl-CoA carboxylase biotin carboxyl carrier protein
MAAEERVGERSGEVDPETVRFVIGEAKALIRSLEGTATSRVVIRAGAFEIDVSRAGVIGAPAMTPPTEAGAAAGAAAPTEATPPARPGVVPIVSPLVGVYYRATSPDAKPLVEIGDTVERGQPVAIVEAMKVMNRVASEHRGTVVEILVENGAPVQYEQPLLLIDTGGAVEP